jgi:hypothetical protein
MIPISSFIRDRGIIMNKNLLKINDFTKNFDEQKIIELNELLMTNGCHILKSHNSRDTLLQLARLTNYLSRFKNVAYIANLNIHTRMIDLRRQLINFKDLALINEFFLDTFYYDLLILEKNVEDKMLCDIVLKSLKSLGLEKSLPIIIIEELQVH